MKYKKIILGILLICIIGGVLFGVTKYVKNKVCFSVGTSLGKDMTDPILKNNKKVLIIRKDFLKNKRNIQEGDLVLYKKDNKYSIKRVASLKGVGYFNGWNTGFFEYKNIRVKDKKNRPFNKTEPAFGISYGIMTLGGTTVKPEGTVVISDKLNKDGTVYAYDVINDFTGWVYPLNINITKRITSIWFKDGLGKLRNALGSLNFFLLVVRDNVILVTK